MGNHLLTTIFLGILVLTACIPTATPTSDAMPPNTIQIDTPVTIDTPAPIRANIVVWSNSDSGNGSLRQALLEAQPGDTISFDASAFPLAAPVTITLATPLPQLVQGNLTINAEGAGLLLDGSQLSVEDTHGLDISSNGNVVRGLEIINFPAAAVGLREGVSGNLVEENLLSGRGSFGVGIWGSGTTGNVIRNNLIGTDRSGLTASHLTRDGIHINQAGQNTITGNIIAGVGQSGIYICCGGAGNTISDNMIGMASDGTTPLSTSQAGITIDQGARGTLIVPGNVIAHNPIGVSIIGADTVGNTITQNRIYGNNESIDLLEGGNGEPTYPIIIGFDTSAGMIEGVTCANCTVEIFSTDSDQGDFYEGQAVSDSAGYFFLESGDAFNGPHLTATTTDATDNTSGFSQPTTGEKLVVDLQADNAHPKTLIPIRHGEELAENYIGDQLGGLRGLIHTQNDADRFLDYYERTGYKWTRLSLDVFEWGDVAKDPGLYSTKIVDPIRDEFISQLDERDITIVYNLSFWDDQINPNQPTSWTRFEDEAEVQRYLDYVRFIVDYFRGRIEYYEVFNEIFYGGEGEFHQQTATLDTYIDLIHRTAEVIRELDPDAKVMAGPAPAVYDQDCYDYQLGILSSDLIMPVVDAVSWHPGPYPVELGGAVDNLYRVPETIQEMQSTAEAHGFTGIFVPEEIQWPTSYNPSPSEPWNIYNETISAKYFGRGILDHRGIGLPALLAGTASEGNFPKMDVIRNLANLLAGARAAPLLVQFHSTLTNVTIYTFTYEDGDGYLIALWENDFATNEIESGTPLTLTLPDFTTTLNISDISDLSIIGYDVLHNFQQTMDAHVDGNSLVIQNLQVRDYPLVVRLSQK